MASQSIQTSRVHRLASRLEQDIRLRGLAAGDRYLSSVEAGAMLGVSPATANRALKILAEQELVIRENNRGTFVGPQFIARESTTIRTVYVLVNEEEKGVAAICSYDLIDGIRRQLPGSNVQFCFLPSSNPEQYTAELIKSARVGHEVVGIVAMSCTSEVYRVLADSGLATLVMGSLYAGEAVLPSLDVDNREAGRLLTEYLLERGHRRVAVFTPAESRPGDNDFLDGVNDSLIARRLLHGTMVIRLLANRENTISAATRDLLASDNPPGGFIVRSAEMAEVVAAVVCELGLKVPNDVMVVFLDEALSQMELSAYPHVRPTITFSDLAKLIGKKLCQISSGEVAKDWRMVIPVKLLNVEKGGAIP